MHEGHTEDDVGGDFEWSSSGSTTGSGAWSVGDDEDGEDEGTDVDLKSMDSCRKGSFSCGMGLLVVTPKPVEGSVGRTSGRNARSGAVLSGRGRGGAQVVAKIRSRSRRTTAGGSMMIVAWLQVSGGGSTILNAWMPGIDDIEGATTGVAR